MAMPPRSLRRRGSSQRWLIIPFTITIVVLLVDASMHARSPHAATVVKTGAWEDQALSAVGASSAQGQSLLRTSTAQPSITTQAVVAELGHIAAQASTTYRTMSKTLAPPALQTAAGLLDAALLARSNGSEEMATAARNALAGARPSVVVTEMSAAVSDFQVGDSAYELFSSSSSLGMRLPASRWVPVGSYSQSSLAVFVQHLTTGVARSPHQPLVIDALSTNPAPLNLAGTVEVLSPASTLDVTVDLSDLGRGPLDGVTVTATLAPAYGSPEQQQSATVSLSAGQSLAVQLPALSPQLSAVSTLSVTASAPSGTAGPVSSSLRLVVPGPGFKGVPKSEQGNAQGTTTSAAPASTTVPGATTVPPTTTSPAGTTTTSPAGSAPASATTTSTTRPGATTTT